MLLFGCVAMEPSTGRIRTARQQVGGTISHEKPAPPELKRLAKGRYRVRKPWDIEMNGSRWHIPKGYSTNGITAPAKIKQAIGDGVDRPETWAAVFHDWLFTQPGVSRQQADNLFYELLVAYGIPAEKARVMYTTVSIYSLSKKLR
jgi:hypothetical protein